MKIGEREREKAERGREREREYLEMFIVSVLQRFNGIVYTFQ